MKARPIVSLRSELHAYNNEYFGKFVMTEWRFTRLQALQAKKVRLIAAKAQPGTLATNPRQAQSLEGGSHAVS